MEYVKYKKEPQLHCKRRSARKQVIAGRKNRESCDSRKSQLWPAIFSSWIGLDWNALFRVDKIVEKNQINECIIQVLAHINRYV